MMLMIRISRSTGATRSAGRRRVVMRNVARLASSRSLSKQDLDLLETTDPIVVYSCANTRASNL
jgi:hypothetical protein